MIPSTPVLRADKLVMRFGGVAALKKVDLEIRGASWRGLIGPNGSGKSTLLNVLTGLYMPQEGRITLGEQDITRRSIRFRARSGIVRTFQHPQLAPTLTVRENVLVGAGLSRRTGLSRLQVRRSADEALELFGCGPYSGALPDEIPYGTRKIVELARVVASRPVIVLMDEPAAGLSAQERIELITALTTFRETAPQVSVCLVEHDVPFVRSLCDELLVLDAGEALSEGMCQAVLADPKVRSAYLGLPAEAAEKGS